MTYRFLSLLLVLLQAPPVLATVSRACGPLIAEVNLWGIRLDRTLEITPGNPVPTAVNRSMPEELRIPAIREATFRINENNVEAVASLIAVRNPGERDPSRETLEAGLRENLANGYHDMPLVPFLPSRVRSKFGTFDHHSCYHAAFTFHEDGSALGFDLDGLFRFDLVQTRYSELGYEDTLQYGDVILFVAQPPPGSNRINIFHAAVYIGGDILYHKYNPTGAFAYELTTMRSLVNIYSNPMFGALQDAIPSIGSQNPFRYGSPFVMIFLRYDPLKQRPPARRNPANIR